MVRETVTLEGHVIDSDVLRRVMGKIVEHGGGFEIDCAVVRRAGRPHAVKQCKVRRGEPVLLRCGGVRVLSRATPSPCTISRRRCCAPAASAPRSPPAW